MNLNKEQIKSFQLVYQDYFGVELDERQAMDQALKLVNLFNLLLIDDKHDGG